MDATTFSKWTDTGFVLIGAGILMVVLFIFILLRFMAPDDKTMR